MNDRMNGHEPCVDFKDQKKLTRSEALRLAEALLQTHTESNTHSLLQDYLACFGATVSC
jgi:hypothetical protein